MVCCLRTLPAVIVPEEVLRPAEATLFFYRMTTAVCALVAMLGFYDVASPHLLLLNSPSTPFTTTALRLRAQGKNKKQERRAAGTS
jgi:hypothetical protein